MNAKIWISDSQREFIIQTRKVTSKTIEGYFVGFVSPEITFFNYWSTGYHKNVGSISKELLNILLNMDFSRYS